MNNIYFIDTILSSNYENITIDNDKLFKDDFHSLSEYNEDYIGEWVRLARAKREVDEGDELVLKLLVELHKKIDKLEASIKNKEKKSLILKGCCNVTSIHYEYIKVDIALTIEQKYYFKVIMPVFPKREIPMFLEAINEDTLKISLMHNKDTNDWDSYVASRQRANIREQKGQK